MWRKSTVLRTKGGAVLVRLNGSLHVTCTQLNRLCNNVLISLKATAQRHQRHLESSGQDNIRRAQFNDQFCVVKAQGGTWPPWLLSKIGGCGLIVCLIYISPVFTLNETFLIH